MWNLVFQYIDTILCFYIESISSLQNRLVGAIFPIFNFLFETNVDRSSSSWWGYVELLRKAHPHQSYCCCCCWGCSLGRCWVLQNYQWTGMYIYFQPLLLEFNYYTLTMQSHFTQKKPIISLYVDISVWFYRLIL